MEGGQFWLQPAFSRLVVRQQEPPRKAAAAKIGRSTGLRYLGNSSSLEGCGRPFVIGLIEEVGGYNSAFLIDGDIFPDPLSRKRSGGQNGLYKPCPTGEYDAVLCRGIGVMALLCDDSIGTEENRKSTLTRTEKLHSDHNILCIPSCMRNTFSRFAPGSASGHYRGCNRSARRPAAARPTEADRYCPLSLPGSSRIRHPVPCFDPPRRRPRIRAPC